ncbi:pseudouridine kinase isoform X1 [Fagus crenata]
MESSVQRRMELFLVTSYCHVLLNGGKVKNDEAEAVIIGGMVLDIHAIPSIPANPRTTTPGKFGVGIRKQQDIGTPVVCNILDVSGELAAAVASGSYLAAESSIPVWFEPVSVAKSRRVASVAKYVTVASPNEDELIAMANALSIWKEILIYLRCISALPASVVRLTRAGDCLVGGMLASFAGLNVMQSVAVGTAAKAAVEAETNVPTTFSLDTIADDARSVYSAANVFNQSML